MTVKTTHLHMLARPERTVPPPRQGRTVVHAKKTGVAFYRSLYDAVGRDFGWTSRKMLSDAELAALLDDPRLEVHVLTADGVLAGFAGLDRRTEGEVERVPFGLMPESIGRGLGRHFLPWAVDKARATAQNASGCVPTPRATRPPCRTPLRRASPSTRKRSRTRRETLPSIAVPHRRKRRGALFAAFSTPYHASEKVSPGQD
jgi:hypothetical protein